MSHLALPARLRVRRGLYRAAVVALYVALLLVIMVALVAPVYAADTGWG